MMQRTVFSEHCEAGREPRHDMIIGGKGTPGGLMAQFPHTSKGSLAGVQSPRLQGDNPRQDGLAEVARR